MMCFRDTTFCCARIHKPGCKRQFTEQDREDAMKWWGGEDAPIAWANFCETDPTDSKGGK